MIAELSGAQLGKEVNSGNLTPIEVINYYAKRIEERNPSINAFVQLSLEEARAEARKLETRLARGEKLGPFAGVPVGLKDFLPSKKGWYNTHGGVPSLQRLDEEDSEFWKAARGAGAIAIGKTNAPAFAFRGTTDNIMFGPTSTPFDITRNSGGSSGGTAAAVADGLIPFGEGSDGGGSIRIPSAWCNCFGFKPSVGVVPSVCRPDAWTATHPYCHNGAITRTVEDSAIMLTLMSRYDSRDPISVPLPYKNYAELMNKPIKDFKIGCTSNFGIFPVDSEIESIVRQSAQRLTQAGAHVESIEFNFPRSADEYANMWCMSISIDTALDLEMYKKDGIDLYGYDHDEVPYEFLYWQNIARRATIFDYRRFHDMRTELLDEFERVFGEYDIIISPTVSCEPVFNQLNGNTLGPKIIAGQRINQLIGYCQTFLTNYTGHPSASVPAGLTEENLPVGMQLIGKKFRDEDVFAVARAFEQIQPWADNYKVAWNRKIYKEKR